MEQKELIPANPLTWDSFMNAYSASQRQLVRS